MVVYIVFGLTAADLPTHTTRIIAVFDNLETAQAAAQEYYKDRLWQKVEIQTWEVRSSV